MNIEVGRDDTDHIAFYCKCGRGMNVTRVETAEPYKKGEHCTSVYMTCKKCHPDVEQWLKFYWRHDKGSDSHYSKRTG